MPKAGRMQALAPATNENQARSCMVQIGEPGERGKVRTLLVTLIVFPGLFCLVLGSYFALNRSASTRIHVTFGLLFQSDCAFLVVSLKVLTHMAVIMPPMNNKCHPLYSQPPPLTSCTARLFRPSHSTDSPISTGIGPSGLNLIKRLSTWTQRAEIITCSGSRHSLVRLQMLPTHGCLLITTRSSPFRGRHVSCRGQSHTAGEASSSHSGHVLGGSRNHCGGMRLGQ